MTQDGFLFKYSSVVEFIREITQTADFYALKKNLIIYKRSKCQNKI